jgi:tetratricopeptide (TPR) repeat protein
MESPTGLTSWDEQGIGRYVEERRQALEEYLRECFSFRGTCRVFCRTLRSDLLRHPLNFILAIPKLFIARIAGVVEKFGWYSLARALQRLSLVLRSGFESAREQQIVTGLIGAPDDAEIRSALDGPLSHFMATRSALFELASGGLTIAVAYSLFGSAGLSPYEMGQRLAAQSAREQATSRFFLGRGVGSAFYHLFPPHPTWGQIASSSALVVVLLGVLTGLLNLLSDPLQQALGVHRRQLSRLLESFEDNLLVQAARRPRGLESARDRASVAPPVERVSAKRRTNQRPERTMRSALANLWRQVAPLPKRFKKKGLAAARQIETRFGRRNTVFASISVLCLLVLAMAFVKRQLHPYAEVRTLIEQRAYVTALARLEQMPSKRSKRSAEYWYWRGQALFGNRQLDGAIEAYQSAIEKNAEYRSDSTVVHDAIEAVATKNHERAKRLILEQIGPSAIEPLREKAVAREDIHRWSLVELIKKLGGENQINYAEVAIADLSCASTCPAKKRAVEKVLEYRAGEAVYALRELDGQPQYKCLQGVLKQALATLGQ